MYGMSESGDNGDELGMRNGSEEGQGNEGCGEWRGCRGGTRKWEMRDW